MPQFINQYNTQNGTQQIPRNTAPQMGDAAMYPVANNGNTMPYPPPIGSVPPPQPTIMDQQGWKMYAPTPSKPLVGRWVMGFEEIKPRDVPMDGSFAIFPQMDQYGNMSCIYAMIWGSDGTIKPYRFLPEMISAGEPANQESQPDPIKEILAEFTSSINNRMGTLERRIEDILTPFASSPNSPKQSNKRNVVKENDAT